MNLFEQASREKLRIQTSKGLLSVEDLWELPLTSASVERPSLDNLARALYKRLSDNNVSFVEASTSKNSRSDELTFEIIKHIIAVRQDEAKQARAARDKAVQKERILEILAQRADKAFESKSDDELHALLTNL